MENKKIGIIKQFIKFGITGGLGTITNLVIFFLLVDIAGFPEIPVSILCFIIAGTQNYIIHHIWSFKEYTGNTRISFLKWILFLSGSLIGLGINIAVMYTIINNFNLPWKFIAQAFGIAAGMIVNFLISKFFIFKRKNNESL